MADFGGEEGFSDDELDTLPTKDFLDLQQNALTSTQQLGSGTAPSVPSGRKVQQRESPSSDIGNGNLVERLGHVRLGQKNGSKQRPLPPTSSDYGEVDDEMLDGEILDTTGIPIEAEDRPSAAAQGLPGESTQREQWRHMRYAEPRSYGVRNAHEHTRQPNVPDGKVKPDNDRDSHEERHEYIISNREERNGRDVAADSSQRQPHAIKILQARIQELENDRDSMQQALSAANSNATSKAGEIAILRANHAKVLKDHEHSTIALLRSRTEEEARQKAEIEAARIEKEKIATENKFLKFNLTESERHKSSTKPLKTAMGKATTSKSTTANISPVTTPKKAVNLPYRDGFDDDEITFVSPSKVVGKSKVATPKAGAKRKRKATEDSPLQPLPLSHPKEGGDAEVEQSAKEGSYNAAGPSILALHGRDSKFEFSQQILNHKLESGHKRSFELLTDFAFSSEPAKALSTIVLDKLSEISVSENTHDFPAAVGLIVIGLWSRCIKEMYYKPLTLLIDLVNFILITSPLTTPSHLIDDLVPLAQITADINAIPRHKRSPESELAKDVNTNICLQALYLTACGCLREAEDIQRFWRVMRFDFILMFLGVNQPVADIQLMLSLLSTSIMNKTIAMILKPDQGDQSVVESHIINLMTTLLNETPRASEGEQPYDLFVLAELRLQVLDLMEKMCGKRHGGEALARSPHAIGKLVRLMHDELDALYDHSYAHVLQAQMVNQATRILFHLRSAYSGLIDMRAKLAIIIGGSHKHLIALTRLAFSEGMYYEQDIEDDVVDCAHRMLEDSVTPEEGEALLAAFSSAKQ